MTGTFLQSSLCRLKRHHTAIPCKGANYGLSYREEAGQQRPVLVDYCIILIKWWMRLCHTLYDVGSPLLQTTRNRGRSLMNSAVTTSSYIHLWLLSTHYKNYRYYKVTKNVIPWTTSTIYATHTFVTICLYWKLN